MFYCREKLIVKNTLIYDRPVEYDKEQIEWLRQHCDIVKKINITGQEILGFDDGNTHYIVRISHKGANNYGKN